MDYPCPNCAFPGAAILPDGSRKCASCGHTWYFRMEYPHPPAARVAVAATSGNARVVVGVVAAAIVMAVGVAVFLFAGGSGGSHQPPPDTPRPDVRLAVPQPQPQPEESGRLSAELGPDVVAGHNGISPWWLVEYRNMGEVSIAFPTVKAHVKDEQDRPVLDHETVASVYRLPPGEAVWMLVSMPGSYKGRYQAEFEIVGPKRADRYTSKQMRLELVGYELQPNPSPSLKKYPYLTGTVRNDSGMRLNSVRVHAIGYDAEGRPCAFAQGYARVTNLQAGQQSDFRMGTGTWQIETPATWRVEAWGTVRD
ncbi:MAG: FxLYD domain-containing protein [Planctomycetota bacterium]|nr:FxLYD domain-containing protein [Planctomycetota bacterium]